MKIDRERKKKGGGEMESKKVIIKNEYSRNRHQYKYSVLEGKVIANTLILNFSKPIFDENNKGLSNCHHEIDEIGIVFSGYGKENPHWIGDIKILNNVQYIQSPFVEYEVRNLFKEKGFVWNRDIKKWEKLR